ncbi:MAG: PAQR family membrane homeostasis protein TrhA [Phreatobacter sp.]
MTFDDGRPFGLTWHYDRHELVADGVVHIIGAAFAVIAAALLIGLAVFHVEAATIVALAVYAASLMAVIGCSAAYNMWPVSRTKWLLRRFDHAAIYLLIAGTYTPFMIRLGTPLSLGVLAGVWAVALVGAAIKLAAPGRFDRLAVGLYLALGWSGVVVVDQVFAVLSTPAACLLVAGGLLYSIGVIFHVWRRLRFQNAIWHGFVLTAAACQYGAVISGVVFAA